MQYMYGDASDLDTVVYTSLEPLKKLYGFKIAAQSRLATRLEPPAARSPGGGSAHRPD